MEKRKNDSRKDYRPIILVGVLIIIAALIFLFLWTFPEAWCGCAPEPPMFEPTRKAIEATNQAVGTAIAETQTAQAIFTGIPRP